MIIRSTLLFLVFATSLASAFSTPHHRSRRDLNPDPEPRRGYRQRKTHGRFQKYFHEPRGSEFGNHYDSRYHHGTQDYEDKRDTQRHMLRAYLTFFQEERLETWLAHGTLLGWWWNGKMLPWDWDIDTQVSGFTIAFLGQHYNRTVYNYTSTDDPPVQRSYLLDINPAFVERERGNGMNIIDARWIDIRNGLYIDVTALSETHPDDRPGVWSCKNYHRYKTTDLYPMRETLYEGVVAKVPYAYDRILTQEYHKKALVLTEYEGHRWNPEQKEWIKKTDEEIAAEKAAWEEARKKEKEEREKAKEAKKKEEGEEEEKKNGDDQSSSKKLKRGVMTVLEKETSGLEHLRR